MHLNFHSAPTWTLKSRNQTTTKSNQPSSYPSPFHYDYNKKTQRSATYAIGNQKRRDQIFKVTSFTPGPGAYQAKQFIQDGPKRTMSARIQFPMKPTPGPHQYDNDTLKVKNKTPTYSMSTKSKYYNQIQRDNNLYKPAPNIYDATKGSFSNPKGVIGTSRRRDLDQNQKTPGPAAYMTIQKLEKAKSISHLNPRCSIGTNFRKTEIKQISDTPGPGTYEKKTFCQENKEKKKGYSVRPKTADLFALSKAKLPGPGYYESNLKNKRHSPQYQYGTEKRKTFIDNAKSNDNNPPPGSHNPNSDLKFKSTQSHTFDHSKRRPLNQNQNTVGPAQYKNNSDQILKKAPIFSIGKSTIRLDQFLAPRDTTPGPNVYEPKIQIIKSGSKITQMQKSQRPNFDKAKYSPGPGYYNLREKESGPRWIFSTEKRVPFTQKKEAAKIPGVGDYEIKGCIPDAPKYMKSTSKIDKSRPLSSR